MPTEGACSASSVSCFVVRLICGQNFLLGVAGGNYINDQQLACRENDSIGSSTGIRDECHIGNPVAAEQRDGHLQRFHVLSNDGGFLVSRPANYSLSIRTFNMSKLRLT